MLPQNAVGDIIKFFNVFVSYPTTVGKKFKVDFALIGIINEEGELTKLGERLTCLDDHEKVSIIKEKVIAFPKMLQLKTVIASLPRVTAQTLVEEMPLDFFSNGTHKTKIYLATKALTWLR